LINIKKPKPQDGHLVVFLFDKKAILLCKLKNKSHPTFVFVLLGKPVKAPTFAGKKLQGCRLVAFFIFTWE
jgi:hypothetical protein